MGGALGWDGAMQLQWFQFWQVAWTVVVMTGQKIDDSAQASIEVTQLWAECNADMTVSRRHGEMITMSLYVSDDAIHSGEVVSELEVFL